MTRLPCVDRGGLLRSADGTEDRAKQGHVSETPSSTARGAPRKHDTHIRRQRTDAADELPSLLRDLDPRLAVVSSGGWAGSPNVVYVELSLEARGQSALDVEDSLVCRRTEGSSGPWLKMAPEAMTSM